jgi:3-phenylpropionate/cinnamic acid dioxygenase small subunit
VSSVGAPADAAVARLADTAAVVDVCVRYAMALDGRDWELLTTCFEPDAIVEYEGMEPIRGIAAIVDVCRRALEPLDVSQHLLGNHRVLLDGDRASSECYLHAQHVRGELAPADKYVVAGTYVDTFARREDAWRISRRRLDVRWTDGNPDVLAPA